MLTQMCKEVGTRLYVICILVAIGVDYDRVCPHLASMNSMEFLLANCSPSDRVTCLEGCRKTVSYSDMENLGNGVKCVNCNTLSILFPTSILTISFFVA